MFQLTYTDLAIDLHINAPSFYSFSYTTTSWQTELYLILQQWSPDWGSGNLNKATPMDGSNKAGPSGPNQSTSLELSTSTVPALKEWRPNWGVYMLQHTTWGSNVDFEF
ncbi:hypothetical protein BT96DRAFT_944714 [Gymnopus androsaceus JB14]|uniref:Uncharacterized protein n=1 Tax=Gymnopus androsaceus JB14 TaxID=1447944 RepID=A0A6A4H4Z5_9AGAR|nr:hypothetical protein BT96DRAFT_944714 [Gymnopus androsaceus JB14]